MSQDTKQGMIVVAYYISFPFASLYFLNLSKTISNEIISNIVAIFALLFLLFCFACLGLLSFEFGKAKDAEMYENQAQHYQNLYIEEVIKHGKIKKENETS